jgi:hypothetical protein
MLKPMKKTKLKTPDSNGVKADRPNFHPRKTMVAAGVRHTVETIHFEQQIIAFRQRQNAAMSKS